MIDTLREKRQIYLLILIWIIWIFFVSYWVFKESWKITWNTEQNIISDTNDIISNVESLPEICNQTLSLLNCMISSPQLSWDKEGINQYYQKLISEWNITTDSSILESKCTQQYTYIQWLQETWYQQIIKSCL